MKAITRALILIAAVVSAALPAGAQERIDLSPAQKQDLQQLVRENKQKTMSVRRSLMENRRALLNTYSQYDLNEKKARESIDEINDLQRRLLRLNYENQAGLRRILTRDQFERFSENVGQRPGRFGKRPGGHGPDGDPLGMHEPGDIGRREIDRLNLTQDQKERIERLFRETAKPSFEQMRSSAEAVRRLYQDYDLNEKRADELLDRINDAQRKGLDASFRRQVELRKILSKEQFTKLMEEVRRGMQQRRPGPGPRRR